MSASTHIASLHEELLGMTRAKIAAIDPAMLKLLGVGLGGATLGGLGAHLATRHADEERRLQTRNRAFGAGVAAGVAGPQVVQGLYNIARGSGFLPGGMG